MTPPVNDNIANAVTIPTGSGTLGPYVIDDATTEGFEASSPFNYAPYKSIWFKFTALDSGTVHLTTQGSAAGDASSGDGRGSPAPQPYGNLDTRIFVGRTTGATPPASTFFIATNDDTGTDPGALWSNVQFNVDFGTEPGFTYWVQVGVFDPTYVGSVVLNYSGVPIAPIHPTLVDVIPECPIEVQALGVGAVSQGIAPHQGEFGAFSDGSVNWYEPGHHPGELLLWIGTGDYLGQSAPAGYTEVFNGEWDNAETDNPSPRGAMAASNYPVNSAHVSLIIAYRIATDEVSNAVANATVAGTITGLSYSERSYPLWQAASGGDGNTSFAVRVYKFNLLQMGGEYPAVDNWPANPVKVGDLVNTEYHRDFATNQVSPSNGYNPWPIDLDVPDTTADHIGNHVYMTLVMNHGPVQPHAYRTIDPAPRRTTYDLLDQFFLRNGPIDYGTINAGSEPDGTLWTGDHDYNDITIQPYVSNTSYFNPFIPASRVPSMAGNITWTAENGFSDTTPAPGHSIQADARTDGTEIWWDGGLGTPGVDWYNWVLTGAVGLIQLVIQGPEVTRPPNDDRANAYVVPSDICPITLYECVFGPTSEPGETWGGLGTTQNSSVWFLYVPTVSQSGVVIRTYRAHPDEFEPTSTYDTILVIYDADNNIVASNDDFSAPGSFRLSQVTVDVTGGASYWIQVAGYGGGEGDLYLTIDSQCFQAYWGINASTPT